MLPTSLFLSGKSHGQRSLVGFSPWGHEESDTAERLTLSLSSSFTALETWGLLKLEGFSGPPSAHKREPWAMEERKWPGTTL